MYPWHCHLEGRVVVKGVVPDFQVHANSDCWILGCYHQGDAKPIQRSVSVLVLGDDCLRESHIPNGGLWSSDRSSVDIGMQLSIVHKSQDFPS